MQNVDQKVNTEPEKNHVEDILSGKKGLILFDSECLICSRCVKWLAKNDTEKRLCFASLQDWFKEAEKNTGKKTFDTALLYYQGVCYQKSDAMLFAIKNFCKRFSFSAQIFLFIPKQLRDWFYGLIAQNRKSLQPKEKHCSINKNYDLSERTLMFGDLAYIRNVLEKFFT